MNLLTSLVARTRRLAESVSSGAAALKSGSTNQTKISLNPGLQDSPQQHSISGAIIPSARTRLIGSEVQVFDRDMLRIYSVQV
jgi:hypothetical protein